MKIGFCTPSILFPEGGVGNYIRNLSEAIAEIDTRNDYLVFGNPQSFQEYGLDSRRFDLIDRGVLTRYRGLRLGWEHVLFPLECSLRSVNLIHAMMFVIPFVDINKAVVTIYDMGFHLYPQYHQASKVAYFTRMIERSARRADLILTISQHTKDEICEVLGVPEQKVRVTHLAHQCTFQRLGDSNKIADVKKRLKITKPYVLFVGTIEPRKNVARLLEAFARVKNDRKKAYELVIAGRRGWGCDVDAWIAELGLQGEVILTDVVLQDDLITLYNGCEVFVYPSLYEGFGIPILEAMSCGAPVITSNRSSMAEVAGQAALLIDPHSAIELAAALEYLLSDEKTREDYRRQGLARAGQFSWHNTARQTVAAYDEVFQQG